MIIGKQNIPIFFTLINSAGAARFYDAIGNHGFYIGAKAENFELDFLTRVIY